MEDDILETLNILNNGGIILYPTDTIWGIGCDATNSEAVSKIYKIKRRANSKSMISLIHSVKELNKWVDKVDPKILKFLENSVKPTTIIYPRAKGLSHNLIAPDGSVAIRITKEKFSHRLCKEFGKPIVSTSANISGDNAPTSFNEISNEIKNAVDYIVKTGRESKTSSPSTIISFLKGDIEYIRK